MASTLYTPKLAARDLRAQRGLSLVELTIAVAIFAVVMVTATTGLQRDARNMGSMARKSGLELQASQMVSKVRGRLEYAQASIPTAFSTSAIGPGAAGFLDADTTAGFPDSGTLLLEPGTGFVERLDYAGISAAPARFQTLTRGVRCSGPAAHGAGVQLRWAGIAEAIEDQVAPPATFFDGLSQELAGPVFFRGDGSGISFRVPVDPAGTGSVFDAAGDIRWGASIRGVPNANGWSCIRFVSVAQITEAARGLDLNGDGDLLDTFDLGALRERSWDSSNPAISSEATLCPPIVLQEACAWGGDMDGDAFADPMFLLDPRSGRLRLRLFLLVSAPQEAPALRRVESIIFLRNGAQQ